MRPIVLFKYTKIQRSSYILYYLYRLFSDKYYSLTNGYRYLSQWIQLLGIVLLLVGGSCFHRPDRDLYVVSLFRGREIPL